MESKMYTIDMNSAYKVRRLNRQLANSKESIFKLQILSGLLIGIIIVFAAAFILQQKNFNKLQTDLVNIQNQYDTLNSQYNSIKTQLENAKNELQSQKDNNTNLTENLVQYSATRNVEEFVYDPDISLSKDLQEYAYSKCKESGLEYPVFLALMRTESSFNANVVSKTNDYGLCQINKGNHNWMRTIFGENWDPLDPYDNIDASIYMLVNYANSYNCSNYHILLMNYNMGHGNAVNCFNNGIYSSKYSRTVMSRAKEYGYSGDGTVKLS